MDRPVGTLVAGGREFFLLSRTPVEIGSAGMTFRCVEKTNEAYKDEDHPVLLVTADTFAILQEECEPVDYADELFDVHDACFTYDELFAEE